MKSGPVQKMSLLNFVCLSLCFLISLADGRNDAAVHHRYTRQFGSLNCSLSVFTKKLEGFPTDPVTGEHTCRGSTVNFTQISPQDYVARKEEVFALLSNICEDNCLPSVVDMVDTCLPTYRTSLGRACADNGIYPCWQAPIANNGTGVAAVCYPLVASNFAGSCTTECKAALTDIRSTQGCCVNNVFNTTVFGPQLAQLQVANGQLWDFCSVPRVSFCPLPSAFSVGAGMIHLPGFSQVILTLIFLAFILC